VKLTTSQARALRVIARNDKAAKKLGENVVRLRDVAEATDGKILMRLKLGAQKGERFLSTPMLRNAVKLLGPDEECSVSGPSNGAELRFSSGSVLVDHIEQPPLFPPAEKIQAAKETAIAARLFFDPRLLRLAAVAAEKATDGKVAIQMEVNVDPTKALRLSFEGGEIFLMPMTIDDPKSASSDGDSKAASK
jgi:hypothetical protein